MRSQVAQLCHLLTLERKKKSLTTCGVALLSYKKVGIVFIFISKD